MAKQYKIEETVRYHGARPLFKVFSREKAWGFTDTWRCLDNFLTMKEAEAFIHEKVNYPKVISVALYDENGNQELDFA